MLPLFTRKLLFLSGGNIICISEACVCVWSRTGKNLKVSAFSQEMVHSVDYMERQCAVYRLCLRWITYRGAESFFSLF